MFAEAARAGLPTVATRTGGVADIVVDGETGLLVEENDPESVAATVLLLRFRNPNRAATDAFSNLFKYVGRGH